MRKWEGVTQELARRADDRRTTLRWRRADDEVREGEAIALLGFGGEDGASGYWSARVLAVVMKLIGDRPEMFTYEPYANSEYAATACLGKILHMRVGHLSEPEEVGQNFLRAWMTADTEMFTQFHLPKMLRYLDSQHSTMTISVEELLCLLARWENGRKSNLSAIAAEFFKDQNNTKKGTN